MSKLLFHPTTQLFLASFSRQLPQSLLLSGPEGIGLFTTAQYVAGQHVSYILQPDTTKASPIISVESIRRLYEHTRTKASGRRVVIVDDADTMSLGAQAAFLKLLEEPNDTTHFILTAHTPDRLLATIRSRTQHAHLLAISSSASLELLKSLGISDSTKQTQLLFLAKGLPAELTHLASDTVYFDGRAQLIGDARSFITSSSYQKLQIIQRYRAHRGDALRLIDSILAILQFTIQSKPQEKLVEQLAKLLDARERIAANQNIILQLARAVL